MENLTYLDISFQFFQELWDPGNTQNPQLHTPGALKGDVKNDKITSYTTEDELRQIMARKRDCKRPKWPLPPVVPFLPGKLEYLDASHSKLNHPLFNVTVKDNYSIRRIVASHSMLYCWQGPIYGLHALEHLDLSNNICTHVSTVFFDEFKNLTELNIANNMLSVDVRNDNNGLMMKNLKHLRKLDISQNRLEIVPAKFLWAQSKLQVLNLSHNMLMSFDTHIEHMDRLESVDLFGNHISTIDEGKRATFERIAQKTPLSLNLTGNHLHCYCQHIDTLKWIRKTESTPLEVKLERCFDENENEIPIKSSHDLDRIISKLERECASNYIVIITVTVVSVLVTDIIVGILVYRYRWKLRYWYYITRHYYRRRRGKYQQLRGHNSDSDMKHDVYVICSEEDAGAEFVQDMFRYLNNEHGLDLIEQERHFFANGSLAQMMWAAVHESRVSVFVMTKSLVQEGNCDYQLRICREESLRRGKRMYFSVFPQGFPDDMPHNKKWQELSDLFNAAENLEYPSNLEESETFWRQCLSNISEMMKNDCL